MTLKYLVKNQDGASAVLVAIVVAMLLGFTVLAVDVGYMYSTRNELQNVADAAALAGAGELGRIYLSMDISAQQTFNVDAAGETYRQDIYDEIQATAVQNKAAGANISIDIDPGTSDVTIGIWDWDSSDPATALTAEDDRPDAVRVIARRDSAMNNPVSTFFGFIFSFFGGSADTFEVSAVATAALSGSSTVADGVLKAPFAISQKSTCPDEIVFSPTTSSCAGWHNFFDDINANAVKQKMIDLIEGFDGTEYGYPADEGHQWLVNNFTIQQDPTPEQTPAAGSGDMFDFQGGVIAALFASGGYYPSWDNKDYPGVAIEGNSNKPIPFINLFDFYRFRDGDDPMITLCNDFSGIDNTTVPNATMGQDADGNPVDIVPGNTVWTTTVPVYKEETAGSECTNPTGEIEIIGFANVHIVMPNPPPDNTISICLECYAVIEAGRGGGGTAGNVMGNIPNLVQ